MNQNTALRSINLYVEERRISTSLDSELFFTRKRSGNSIKLIGGIATPTDLPSIVVMMNGSFSPLTVAHVDLAEAGLKKAREKYGRSINDELLFLIGTKHAHKKMDIRTNAAISDRLHSLDSFATAYGNVSLAITNKVRYMNTLPLIQAAYGNQTKVCALIGADVLEEIVNPKYYDYDQGKMHAALEQVFKFDFLVSQRAYKFERTGKVELVTVDMLAQYNPILEDFREQILEFELKDRKLREDLTIAHVSSTRVRNLVGADEPYEDLVAVGLSDFVEKTGLYLQSSNFYPAYVSAVRLFTDRFYNPDTKRIDFVGKLCSFLEKVGINNEGEDNSTFFNLREQTITAYESYAAVMNNPDKSDVDARAVLDEVFKQELFGEYVGE